VIRITENDLSLDIFDKLFWPNGFHTGYGSYRHENRCLDFAMVCDERSCTSAGIRTSVMERELHSGMYMNLNLEN